jgi:hypothetical protein
MAEVHFCTHLESNSLDFYPNENISKETFIQKMKLAFHVQYAFTLGFTVLEVTKQKGINALGYLCYA